MIQCVVFIMGRIMLPFLLALVVRSRYGYLWLCHHNEFAFLTIRGIRQSIYSNFKLGILIETFFSCAEFNSVEGLLNNLLHFNPQMFLIMFEFSCSLHC